MGSSKHQILFASDLTVNMKEVFAQAARLAALENTGIVVLHVMEDSAGHEKQIRMAFGEKLYRNLKNEHKQGARDVLIGKNIDALRIKKAISGFFVNSGEEHTLSDQDSLISKILVAESSSIADEIVGTAESEDCRMIVIGCKKHSLLAEAMGDHLVRKVLKRSSMPVLVVPFK